LNWPIGNDDRLFSLPGVPGFDIILSLGLLLALAFALADIVGFM